MHQELFDTLEQMIPMTAKDKDLCLQYFKPFTHSTGILLKNF
ncbi:hypothetical protein [Arthrospiribacter ruber]|nr:hypothetical protein [Arthrospiribacter ruber]